MAYLSKKQYEHRSNNAALRNARNAQKAIANGMTEEQADLITQLCGLRHDFHCNMEKIAEYIESKGEFLRKFRSWEAEAEKENLPELFISGKLEDIDEIEGLEDYYGEDVPEDNDSDEYKEWYSEEYSRIYDELSELHKKIERYLKSIDEQYNTEFCPTGIQRIY
jgi:hypothetical protein|nr:MAG TPA: Cpf1/RNA Complex FUNCTION-RNA complex.49A [Caudoviricetes sp.]